MCGYSAVKFLCIDFAFFYVRRDRVIEYQCPLLSVLEVCVCVFANSDDFY